MTQLVLVVAGALLAVLAFAWDEFLFAGAAGLALALVLTRVETLLTRVRKLEQALRESGFAPDARARRDVIAAPASPGTEAREPDAQKEIAPSVAAAPGPESRPEQTPAPPTATGEPVSRARQAPPREPEPAMSDTGAGIDGGVAGTVVSPHAVATVRPPRADDLISIARDWFLRGNVPVKVGVIVSFFGIAFLLKYAVDRNLLVVPMWLRLVFAALFGLTLLAVGWRLRNKARVYALSLQGGGVGIVYLTVFAAFRLYGLLPPVPAFILLAAITIPAAWLAVVQDARAMAVLAFTGGFLAPVLTSTGQGSHVALFGYYLLLNVAILAVALFKSWRELNLVGFLFTFVIGTLWGYRYYRPAYFASTEPFLVAHFLLYTAAAVLFAWRQPRPRRGIVDSTLVFGTPIVVFALQAALLRGSDYGLAISAFLAAVLYGGLAWWLRRAGAAMQLLAGSFAALGLGFATIAVPLAFDARWTTATWAMEGAALVWLTTRQPHWLTRVAGVALIFLAGGAFAWDGWNADAGVAVVNGNVLSAVLLSLAGFFAARCLDPSDRRQPGLLAPILFVWGMAWWLGGGLAEIDDRVRSLYEYPVMIVFFGVSAIVLGFVARRTGWTMAQFGTLALVPLLALTLDSANGHPFRSYAGFAWILAAAAHLYVLRPFQAGTLTGMWHAGGVLLAALVLTLQLQWVIGVTTWTNTAISLMLSGLVLVCCYGDRLFRWPLAAERVGYVTAAGLLAGVNLAFNVVFGVESGGDPLPLAYLPLVNPYDIAMMVALGVAVLWSREAGAIWKEMPVRPIALVLAVVALCLSTLALVRAVHHLADIPWRLFSLANSVEVQAALSLYWSLLGFAGMVLGARRRWRQVWFAGAALMTVVVAKLFLVDLGNSGTLARIVSFIGVGASLLVVGYFAPVPPRMRVAAREE